MYTLRSTVCPGHLINEERRLSQSEDMTCDDAKTEKPSERGAQSKISQLEK